MRIFTFSRPSERLKVILFRLTCVSMCALLLHKPLKNRYSLTPAESVGATLFLTLKVNRLDSSANDVNILRIQNLRLGMRQYSIKDCRTAQAKLALMRRLKTLRSWIKSSGFIIKTDRMFHSLALLSLFYCV